MQKYVIKCGQRAGYIMKYNIEIYVNGVLKNIIPNLSNKKVEQYKKALYIENGYYKIVQTM